jgi:hypothetical protein
MGVVARILPTLQRITEAEMPDTVTIYRPGEATANAGGAMVPGEDTEIETVGRVSSLSIEDREGIIGGEQRTEGWQQLTVPVDVSLQLTDQISVGATRYSIEQVVPRSSFAVHRKALVRPL